jgi:hypothetical protein
MKMLIITLPLQISKAPKFLQQVHSVGASRLTSHLRPRVHIPSSLPWVYHGHRGFLWAATWVASHPYGASTGAVAVVVAVAVAVDDAAVDAAADAAAGGGRRRRPDPDRRD